MRTSKPIMLVEDDSVDAMTVKRALKDLKVSNPFVHQVNGEEALKYLRTDENNKPCVILLDLNMPKMNGIEFLKIAKADAVFRQIPVIVLTTSKDDHDKIESFQFSVAGYIVKPTDYKKFVDAMKTVDLYWSLSELPNSGA
ncbi:MAG: response regulator [Planctomycetota bacterium]